MAPDLSSSIFEQILAAVGETTRRTPASEMPGGWRTGATFGRFHFNLQQQLQCGGEESSINYCSSDLTWV